MTIVFVVLTVVCSLVDLLLSLKSMSVGTLVEGNPVMHACVVNGAGVVSVVKVLATAFYAAVILNLDVKRKQLAFNCSAVVAAIYLLLMYHWLLIYSPN